MTNPDVTTQADELLRSLHRSWIDGREMESAAGQMGYPRHWGQVFICHISPDFHLLLLHRYA